MNLSYPNDLPCTYFVINIILYSQFIYQMVETAISFVNTEFFLKYYFLVIYDVNI